MTTVRDVIVDALSDLGVINDASEVDPSDSALALRHFNNMLFAWKNQGVDVSHSALGLNDTFPLDSAHLEATTILLADRLARPFEEPSVDPALTQRAWLGLHAAYNPIPTMNVDIGLTKMPSQYRYGNTRVHKP